MARHETKGVIAVQCRTVTGYLLSGETSREAFDQVHGAWEQGKGIVITDEAGVEHALRPEDVTNLLFEPNS